MFQTMQRLVKVEGWRGLYRGYTAGLLGTVHGGVQFYVLEELKKHYVVDKQSHLQMILFPAFSKCIGKFVRFRPHSRFLYHFCQTNFQLGQYVTHSC